MIRDEDYELLSAYVDGELDGRMLTEFRERLLAEPDLRRELDAMTKADELMKSYSAQIDQKAVPNELQSLVAVHSVKSASRLFAVAASVFAVTIGGFLLMTAGQSGVNYAMIDALESGQRTSGGTDDIEVIASFRQHDGSLCREIKTQASRQVVCRAGNQWRMMIESPHQALPENSYQPAGEDSAQKIDVYVQRHMTGVVLDVDEERRLIRQNWLD